MNIFTMSLEEINVTISSGSVNVLPEKFTTVLPGSLKNEFLVHMRRKCTQCYGSLSLHFSVQLSGMPDPFSVEVIVCMSLT